MADIRPFRGVHYNPLAIKDLTRVICPPYDIISPEQQQHLYQLSDFNFVRIEFGRTLPQDHDNDNRYTRAAATMEKWLHQGILIEDECPALYVVDQEFQQRSKRYRRRGITAIVRLEEWDRHIIRPHEGTLPSPKDDRLNMLWALGANTSPIMALYEDDGGRVAALLRQQTRHRPILKGTSNGDTYWVWAIDDAETIGQVQEYLAGKPLYIADGHHRYESALSYRRTRKSASPPGAPPEPFDFVMMTLIEFNDPGLVILPAHRLVRGLPPSVLDMLQAGLKLCFEVEELPAADTGSPEQVEKLLQKDGDEARIIIYGLKHKSLRLKLKDYSLISLMIPYFHSEVYPRLDVSIVDHVILEELLGLSHEAAGTYINYTHDITAAIKGVREQEYQMAILVNPVRPGDIKAIADHNDRMPRKSTYFFPKIPAGLVFYRFGK